MLEKKLGVRLINPNAALSVLPLKFHLGSKKAKSGENDIIKNLEEYRKIEFGLTSTRKKNE